MSNGSLKRKLDSSDEFNSVESRCQILNEKLSRRPQRNDLIKQGILYDSQCAPSLQYAEHALKKARLADELNHRLLNRPGPLDLIQHNILHIDTNQYPHLEQAIQGGEIPFKTSKSRPLIFHEYTGPPSTSKPKITKMDSLISSSSTNNSHQIRLAQQQLLLELTSNKEEEEEELVKPLKSLEQMTLVELKHLCKQYQIPSSHANKNKLIQRIKQTQDLLKNIEISSDEIDNSFENELIDENNQIELFSPSELDDLLKLFPIHRQEDQSINNDNDDLFLEMLINNDQFHNDFNFDDLFLTSSSSSNNSPLSLPKITNLDEFDAFLKDFTLNISSNQQQIPTNSS